MTDLPAVNTLVQVVFGDEADFRSRVEDIDGTALVIAGPLDIVNTEQIIEGSDVEVFWTKARARYFAPMRVVERTRGQRGQWRLIATGEATRSNRRQFVRGEDGGPITIIATHGRPEPIQFHGTIIDICEGGVRCRMTAAEIVPDEPIMVRFTISGTEVEIEGTVHSLRPEDSGNGIDVVIEYILEEHDAQVIRRHVMQWQMIERRRQLARQERRLVS
ncbi:MAG: PilZ domain-containing protein [Micromonosporaceae bacterium]|nr:PilZ domain-containing protein [Micromonosporaceae bacterium]